jgi:hypothetical protein
LDPRYRPFNPKCPLCKDLDVSDRELIEAVEMRKYAKVHVCASLDEIREAARKGSELCTVVHQAGAHFADLFWKKYDLRLARVDIYGTMPVRETAKVHLSLVSHESGTTSKEGHDDWSYHEPRSLSVPIDLEICRTEGIPKTSLFQPLTDETSLDQDWLGQDKPSAI